MWCDADVAELDGGFQFDAIAHFAPFRFEASVAGWFTVRALGESFASIRFDGTISGPAPWTIDGRATVELPIVPDIHVRVGPLTWGGVHQHVPAPVDPLETIATALRSDSAWRSRLPAGADRLVTLASTADTAGVHPLGVLEAHQGAIPLEFTLERVGAAPVTPVADGCTSRRSA